MLIADAIGAWGNLRASMRKQLNARPKEARILFYGLLASVLAFVAAIPDALDQAATMTEEDAVAGVLVGRLFGAVFLAPLVFYGLAAVIGLVVRRFGVGIGYYENRLAFFWSLLVTVPVLVLGQLAGRLIPQGLSDINYVVQVIPFAVFCWVLSSMISEASTQKQR